MNKGNKIVKYYLKNPGMTMKEIGNFFGVTRQCVNIYLRKYGIARPNNKNKLANPNDSELLVVNKLKSFGVNSIFMPYGSKFDIKTEFGVRIEVKHWSKSKDNYVRPTFFNKNFFDVAVIIVGSLFNPNFYIVPVSSLKKHSCFTIEPKVSTKNTRLFLNNWKPLTQCF